MSLNLQLTEPQSALLKNYKKDICLLQSSVQKTRNLPIAFVNIAQAMRSLQMTKVEDLIDNPPENLFTPVSYEGKMLPTIDGVPIWEQIPGESEKCKNIFLQYRDWVLKGKGNRSIFGLSKELKISCKDLESMRRIYYWEARINAFDEYRDYQYEMQINEARKVVQGKHYRVADELLDLGYKYLKENEQLLTPKQALNIVGLASKLQRVSVGLNPTDANTSNGMPNVSVNVNNANGENSIASTSNEIKSTITENKDENTQRLAELLNVMDKVDILTPDDEKEEEEEAIDVDYKLEED